MNHPLKEILINRRQNSIKGVVSLCTASPHVIAASMMRFKSTKSPLIIEATANQVNQDGGYTKMKPRDFASLVFDLAKDCDFPKERIILGGDHLGPLVWSKQDESTAMIKAEALIAAYVEAGFTKIHVDTSMKLGSDDPHQPLSIRTIAERGARLIRIAEEAYSVRRQQVKDAIEPVYIIGSEVPIPGGAQEEEGIDVTSPNDFSQTIDTYRAVFVDACLSDVWGRVIGVVVQPGVEFSDAHVHEYDPNTAHPLMAALKNYPAFVFEGHSTDYQTKHHLRTMVDDGIAILKVGPALTYALRQGLFALASMEDEWIHRFDDRSHFKTVLEQIMISNPDHWIKHYHGDSHAIQFACKHSFSDRSRYYMFDETVVDAMRRLMLNMIDIPWTLLSQYMPNQYRKVREGLLINQPQALIYDWVNDVIDDYFYACER